MGWTLNFESTRHAGKWPSKYTCLDQFPLTKKFYPSPHPPPFSPTILVIFFSPKWNVKNSVWNNLLLGDKDLTGQVIDDLHSPVTRDTHMGECAIATLQPCFRQISFVTLLTTFASWRHMPSFSSDQRVHGKLQTICT